MNYNFLYALALILTLLTLITLTLLKYLAIFYFYYNNSDATAGSSLTDTFIWADDFSDGTQSWTEDTSGTITMTEANSRLTISNIGGGSYGAFTNTTGNITNTSHELVYYYNSTQSGNSAAFTPALGV